MTHRFQLHLITDRQRACHGLVPAIQAALLGDIDWVQVRETSGTARELYETVLAIAPPARAAGVGILVNDRVDVALATDAGGVHLAQRSLPPDAVRRLIGNRLLGVSVHSVDEARAAVAHGVDYVTFGHLYATQSKPGMPPRGLKQLAEVVESVPVPVLAIGGINVSNAGEVLRTGCAGIVVISAILAVSDQRAAAYRLRQTIDDVVAQPRYPFPVQREEYAR